MLKSAPTKLDAIICKSFLHFLLFGACARKCFTGVQCPNWTIAFAHYCLFNLFLMISLTLLY